MQQKKFESFFLVKNITRLQQIKGEKIVEQSYISVLSVFLLMKYVLH